MSATVRSAPALRLVALLRGINVGRAKRIAMADLRATIESLGYRDVRTLLNSGNAVFTAAPATTPDAAAKRIQAAIAAKLGVSARATVITATELEQALAEHPLKRVATDPSRLLVVVPATPADHERFAPLAKRDWSPGALALGARVAYLWCPDGILASPLVEAVGHALGDAVTSRNWATMTKLLALGQAEVEPAARSVKRRG